LFKLAVEPTQAVIVWLDVAVKLGLAVTDTLILSVAEQLMPFSFFVTVTLYDKEYGAGKLVPVQVGAAMLVKSKPTAGDQA
jgi:hypothetical protein